MCSCLPSSTGNDEPSGQQSVQVDAKPHLHPFRYSLDYPNIGYCVIINNKNFDPKTGNTCFYLCVILVFLPFDNQTYFLKVVMLTKMLHFCSLKMFKWVILFWSTCDLLCTGMNQRNGTDVDAGNIMNVFRKLGYIVKVYNDQTAQQIVQVLTAGMCL